MLRRRHLGRVSFAEANDFQRALMESSDDYVMLLEHPPICHLPGTRPSGGLGHRHRRGRSFGG